MGSSVPPSNSIDAQHERQRANSEMNHLEFLQKRTELISLPRRIVFELTNRCHANCTPCGRAGQEHSLSDLPVPLIRRFEGVLAFVEEVTLHGRGEGTLHPHFAEIMGFLNSIPGLRKNFVTNGTPLDRIHWVVFEHHVDILTLRLDGICPVTLSPIHSGEYETKIESLRKLLVQKEQRGLDHPYVHLVFTAMRQNLETLPELIDRAAELGIPAITVEYLTVHTPELLRESLFDRQEEVRPVFAEVRRRATGLGIRLNLPDLQGEGEAGEEPHRICPLPWQDLYIGSNGRLRPCRASDVDLGPAGEWENIYDLWNSPAVQNFRRWVNTRGKMPEGCAGCCHSWIANFNRSHSFLQIASDFPSPPEPTLLPGNRPALLN